MRAVHMGGNWGNNIDGIKSNVAIQRYLDDLKSRHVEWIGVSVAMFIDGVLDPTLRVHYRPAGATAFALYTFEDADLVHLLTVARQQGFRLYLTLAIERNGATGTADPACNTASYVPERWLLGRTLTTITPDVLTCMNPSDWWWEPGHPLHAAKLSAFWSSYSAIATKYATIAQQTGVDIFSLGTETEGLFRARTDGPWIDHYGAQLQSMVAAVRAVYSGWLTYDQSYNAIVSRGFFSAQRTIFSDLGLDIAGVSAAFPLATTARLYSQAELETMWLAVFNNYVLPLQQQNPARPVIFLEFGYTDDVGTVVQANTGEFQPLTGSTVTEGMQQQSNVLAAFFKVNNQLGQPVRGAFVWSTDISTPVDRFCAMKGFHIWCKPADAVLTAAYQDLALRDTARVFDWAEVVFPQFFPGPGAAGIFAPYTYRYYAATGIFLITANGRVLVHNGLDLNLLDVGSVGDYLAPAQAAGF